MNKVRVFHIRDKLMPNTAATLAIQKQEDDTFAYGVSICSPNDQFCKRIGRAIATGRLRKRAIYAVNFEHLLIAIKHHIRAAWVPRGFTLDADILCKLLDERMETTRAFAEATNVN